MPILWSSECWAHGQSCSMGPNIELTLCSSEKKVHLPMQPLWAGMILRFGGTGFLYFDWESRNDQRYVAGYGVGWLTARGKNLWGYGFSKCYQQWKQYAGLLRVWSGLYAWTLKAFNRGDSEIVQQVTCLYYQPVARAPRSPLDATSSRAKRKYCWC
jgi:hypothetical protein